MNVQTPIRPDSPPPAIRLRDVSDADLPIFYEHQRDPEATRMAVFPSREHEAFMAHWASILADESLIKMTILYDGQVATHYQCKYPSPSPQVGEKEGDTDSSGGYS